MKLSVSIAGLFLSSLVASKGLSLFGGQTVLTDKPAVPGDNPLVYCAVSHPEDILVLEYVDLNPNPPTAYAGCVTMDR
jgi:hypothetical protein